MTEITGTVFCDGGARGNPGPAAIGAVIKVKNKFTKNVDKLEISAYIGEKTNNEAEYQAVIKSLKETKKFLGKSKTKKTTLDFFIDSELIVMQLNRQYKIKEPRLLELFIKANNEIIDFKKVNFYHIRREKNKEADALVSKALDKQIR
ncbi:MAG: reverse transcriptase-like protein [Candidatus Moranbacteria bacterium]|nr:reverse transcriptase-like protein [Candidatus Moranbacteria bacterium]